MNKAFNLIFFGTIITFFNLNIGLFNLFPDFIGYIMIAVGLSKVITIKNDNSNSAKKANIIAWILAIYTFIIMFTNEAFGGIIPSILYAVFMTAEMIMSYHILSSGVNDENRETVSKQQRTYLIITTIAISSSCVYIMMPAIIWVTFFFSFASKIYFIYLCQNIRRQYKAFVSDDVQ